MFKFESTKKLAKLFNWKDCIGNLTSSFWGEGEELFICPNFQYSSMNFIAFCGKGEWVGIRIPISLYLSSYNPRYEALCYSIFDEMSGVDIFEVYGYNSNMCVGIEIKESFINERNHAEIENVLLRMANVVKNIRYRLDDYGYTLQD